MKEPKHRLSHTMRIDILSDARETLPDESAAGEAAPPPRRPAQPGAPLGHADFQQLFQSVYDAALIAALDGAILDANARALEFFQHTLAEARGLNITDLIAGTDASLLLTLQSNLAAHRFTLIQAYCRRRDQTLFPAEISVSWLRLAGQRYFCCFVRDTTLRRKAEETLTEERNLLRTLIDNMPDFIYVKDTASRFIIGNAAVARLMGAATPDDLAGKTDAAFYPRELAARYADDERRVVTTGEPLINYEEPCVDSAGHAKLLLTTKVPLRDHQGHVVGIIGIGRDITERRLMENQEAHTQKMESIGQLAAGIAHEINTPVQYIGDNLRFLQDTFGGLLALLTAHDRLLTAARAGAPAPDLVATVEAAAEKADVAYVAEEIPRALEQSLDGVNRVARIVRAMKEFSHPDSDEKEPADLNKAIESTITVSRNEWKYVAEVVTDFDPDLPPVPCQIGHINQVILNLIVNAAHAVADVVRKGGEKGRIAVATRHADEWAEIRVTDSGTGIPEAIRHRVFEPFFTTKEVGRGTGQGLSVCHSIVVKKHGGTIAFETEEGRGTTFIVRLPLTVTG